jgi:TM2 domain-containing membrane protein YozV
MGGYEMKDKTVAWLLWFFLSGVGGHNFYLGKTKHAIGYIVLNLLGALTFWFGLGFIFWLGLTVWWIIDAVNLNKEVDRLNAGLQE